MTRATQTLRQEHQLVSLLLDCLEQLVRTYRAGETFDAEAARELQALFEHFVDEQHQEKEESALFPKILERVQRLQDEHVEERGHLDRMRFSLFNAALGDPAGREQFIHEAQAYVQLQRRHVDQENRGLLPLAEQLLTEQDDEEALEEFRLREAEGIDPSEVVERLRALCSRLKVPFEAGAASVPARTG